MERKVREVAQFPSVQLTTRSVAGQKAGYQSYSIQLRGIRDLNDPEKEPAVVPQAKPEVGALTAREVVPLLQPDFGITPFSAGQGAVKIKEVVRVLFDMTARRLGVYRGKTPAGS